MEWGTTWYFRVAYVCRRMLSFISMRNSNATNMQVPNATNSKLNSIWMRHMNMV